MFSAAILFVPTSICCSRSRLLRSPKPLGHAAQRLNGSVVNFSAATEAEPALPLVSDNAAAEVPHAEVASQDDLSAAIEKTESGPATTSDGQPQLKQQQQQQPSASAGPRGNGVGRPGGRASRRPRTIGPEQLVPGAQFEGNVVRAGVHHSTNSIGVCSLQKHFKSAATDVANLLDVEYSRLVAMPIFACTYGDSMVRYA